MVKWMPADCPPMLAKTVAELPFNLSLLRFRRAWWWCSFRYCHEEMATARKHGLTVVGVKEEDGRFGKPDFELERQRGMTGGADGGPVHVEAHLNLELLDKVCFISRRTQQHEINGMLSEVLKQGVEMALVASGAAETDTEEQPTTRECDEDPGHDAQLSLTTSQKVTIAQSQPAWAGKLWLPAGKNAHFCICAAERSSGAVLLCQQLTEVGCRVVHPQPTADGMAPGTLAATVKGASCLLLYLGGGQQVASKSSGYKGVFASDFCHEQIRLAQVAELPVIGVMEEGFREFPEEKASCVDTERNAQHLGLLETVCFIQARTQAHEVRGFLSELLTQWTQLSQHQRRRGGE
eukprot:SAG22_NODE_2604_length_2395_cov_1.718641_3_plen_350_part_00